MIILTVVNGRKVLPTDGLLSMLGLDDGLGGVWLDAGTYSGDCPFTFATRNVMRVHLEETITTNNMVDRALSTLLTCIDVGCHYFGNVHAIRVEHPEYKLLQNGTVTELKITIRDESGSVINNYDLPIYLTLEVVNKQR